MKKFTRFCDACGKEIPATPSYFNSGTVHLCINEWGGGSVGGAEDIFEYEAQDLCEDCAHEIQRCLTRLGLKRK